MNRTSASIFCSLLTLGLFSSCAGFDPDEEGSTTAALSVTPDTINFRELTITEDLASGGHRQLRIRGLVVGTLGSAGTVRICRAVSASVQPDGPPDCAEPAAHSVRRTGRLCDLAPTSCMVQPSADGSYALSAGAVSAGKAACGALADSQPCYRFELAIALTRIDREPTYLLQSVPGSSLGVSYSTHSCVFTPSTGLATCDALLRHWLLNGGVDVFGEPTSDERIEVSKDGVHRRAQWFRGARLELVSASVPAAQVDPLGREWIILSNVQLPDPPPSADAGCVMPAGARFSVCPPFVDTWRSRGGSDGPGLPLSGPFIGHTDSGDRTMQLFERARLEISSTNAAPVFGSLGDAVRRLRPALISVPSPDGHRYGIEESEVTRAQYDSWIARGAPVGSTSAACAAVQDHHALEDCLVQIPACQAKDCGRLPQTCVSWCDAEAYCSSLGRRLCGAIGGSALSPAERAVTSKGEWLNACTSAGRYDYPYGSAVPRDGYCQDGTQAGPAPVASRAECQSPDTIYRGVFDLSGNVWEWDNSCDDGADPGSICYARGGAAGTGYGRCGDMYAPGDRSAAAIDVGFRCCGPVGP
jgi:hypothetical protein